MLRSIPNLLWTIVNRSSCRRNDHLRLSSIQIMQALRNAARPLHRGPRTRRRGYSHSRVEPLEIRLVLSGAPVFDQPGYFFEVSEDALPGSIGSVSATDPDGPDVTYSGGSGPFSVEPVSGAISFVGSLDYETQDWYSFEVFATDPDSNSGSEWVDVYVTDVDDEPPYFDPAQNTFEFEVFEDALIDDYTIGDVWAPDPDTDETLITYTILETGIPFAVDSLGTLTVSAPLDYETTSSYTFTIRATDPAGNFDEATFTIDVLDVDPYPEFDPLDYEFSVPEDAEFGTVVGQVHASDPEGEPLTFGLDDGYGGPVQFLIDANGVITVASPLDYETAMDHYLTAYASDPAQQTATANVTIFITDVDDEPPAFDLEQYTFDIAETESLGFPLGTLYASDDDTAPEDLIYSIVDVGVPFTFGSEGELLVDGPLDHETLPSYTFTVRVTDTNGNTDEAGVTVNVADVNPIALDDIMYAGQGDPTDNDVTFYVLENDSHTHGELLTIIDVSDPANGSVTFTATDVSYTPDAGFYSGMDSFTYTVQDIYGETATATVTVNMVEVTGWELEWKDDAGNWNANGSGEIVWWDQELRWTAQHSSNVPEPPVSNEWKAQPWEDYQNGTGSWQVFTSAAEDFPAEGSPGEGAWAILPVLYFADRQNQSGFTAQLAAANQVAQGVAKVDIHEWNTGTILTGSTQTVIVGQNIHLFAYVTPAILNLPALFGNVGYEWTIPGATTDKAIKSYTMTLDEGKWEDLEAADLDGFGVNFYWIDQLNGQDVKVKVTIGGKSRTAKVTYNVLRPTAGIVATPTTRADHG